VKLAYRWLLENLDPEVMVLVDGGSDSLCRGDANHFFAERVMFLI
jgi:hypothetical protein